jgi:heme-degrading monooxygenase HmoA
VHAASARVTEPDAVRFAAGQVVTVFRSRLRDEVPDGYVELDEQLRARAAELGGLVDVTSLAADDGERVTLVTFADAASHERWARDAVHRDAQRWGRSELYESYSIQVASCTRATEFAVAAEGDR